MRMCGLCGLGVMHGLKGRKPASLRKFDAKSARAADDKLSTSANADVPQRMHTEALGRMGPWTTKKRG